MSDYGFWDTFEGLPTYVYTADQRVLPQAEWNPFIGAPMRQHWIMLGNRRIQLYVANDGGLGLFDESHGLRWLTAPDPEGAGLSIVEEAGRSRWGTPARLWPVGAPHGAPSARLSLRSAPTPRGWPWSALSSARRARRPGCWCACGCTPPISHGRSGTSSSG